MNAQSHPDPRVRIHRYRSKIYSRYRSMPIFNITTSKPLRAAGKGGK